LVAENDEVLFKDPELNFEEYEDYLLIDGVKLKKPFVEKPANAEDHEIKVYYSSLNPCGSGYNILFRKTNNFSGRFIP
jgi:inositol hexakisphosphate/diphosphoinositol-pentakisphosphate kinase